MKSTIQMYLSFLWICSLGISFGQATQAYSSEVAFERDARLPIVYINTALKTGAIMDPEGKSGLTNFMGEMLLRGTKSRTKEQINLKLDQMGAQLEVETRSEALILRGAVLSSQLEPFLSLVQEILTQPRFPKGEIRKLKGEVVSVLREELGNDGALGGRKFNEFLFGTHPYGKSILGKIKDVESFTASTILAQYKRIIQEPLLLVVGTGDATEDRIKRWVYELGVAVHQANPSAVQAPGRATPLEAPQDSSQRRLLIVDKPDRTQTQIFGGQIGVQMTDPEFFSLYLGNHAFGGHTLTSVLMTEVREKRGWSYGAYSSFRHGTVPRSWTFHLFPAEKDTAQALALSLKLIEELKEKGLTQDQFKFTQTSLVNNAGFMYNTPKKRVENKLLERTLNLPDGFMQSFGPALQRVRLSEVNSALKSFLKPDRLALTVVGTASHLKESLERAAGVNVEQVKVVPYTQE